MARPYPLLNLCDRIKKTNHAALPWKRVQNVQGYFLHFYIIFLAMNFGQLKNYWFISKNVNGLSLFKMIYLLCLWGGDIKQINTNLF
jgi:hypothetical protein